MRDVVGAVTGPIFGKTVCPHAARWLALQCFIRGLFVRRSRSTASSLGSKEPRIVAFEQYCRGLEGLARRSTYRAAGAPEGRAHPNSSWASRRGPASLLVPVAAGPAVQSRTHNPARSHD